MGKIYGYARVSSKEQNLDRQILRLQEYVEKDQIIVDKESGATLQRPGYQALKSQLGLRAGDVLYICSLDRLSRNKNDLKNEIRWFQEHNIRLMILDLPTSMIQVPKGQEWVIQMVQNILIEVLASIAENERNTIRQRQREGIEAAKLKGKHLGRPRLNVPDDFPIIYNQWKEKQFTAKEAMKKLGMSSSSFYRTVRKYEKNELMNPKV